MEHTIINNAEENRFEINEMGLTALVAYQLFDGGIRLMHTEVPEQMEGKGIGTALAKYALEYAREHQLKAKVYCPFIQVYLKRHPEYQDVAVAMSR